MPLRLEIKKKLSARSERVKCCDFHPTEPWILASLYSGHVFIWNYVSQSMVKSIEVCELPVRAAKFVASKQWIVCGADDMQIRVYNYNTMERLRTFEAHTDYIRSLAVHPTLPLLLSSSDDMLIKLWDWEKGWDCISIFEGHTHYVMQVEFNPKDSNTFASASLDRTVKIWGLNSAHPHFQLEGHERGVNCIGYFRGGDRPYLVSGADDHMVKIWDYQTKACVATLEGHTSNVSAVCFHPELPIIISGSEDGTVRLWHANTYRLENTLNYGMERVWSIACLKGSNKVAIGYDDGTIMIKIGHEEPVASMERGGKVVWANNHEIVIANVRTPAAATIVDGDRLPIQSKDLGSCELYPQSISHDPKGRLLCACGDGEYIIYTALALKNKSFGTALEFVWANDSGVYATRESTSKIKVFKEFKEHRSFRPAFAAESIFGGALLGVRSNDFVDFYDWNDGKIIRRIDVCPRRVFWSESGEVVVLACDANYYVLRYNVELVHKYQEQNITTNEQGIEQSFELESEVAERVRQGYFVGDCFIYTNNVGRLNYYVGGEVMTLAHLPKVLYLLGYLPKENRVYLMDKSYNIFSYSLLLSILMYQTAIVRRDFDGAKKALALIPNEHYNKLARFLEAQDLKDMALQLTLDPEHKFELAIACAQLGIAREICEAQDHENKWKQLGDLALNLKFDLPFTIDCYQRAHDDSGLLLLYTSLGDEKGLADLAIQAKKHGRHNIAFVCYFLLHRLQDCVQLLIETDRVPEAAFLTRTYTPSTISGILKVWKENVKQVSVTAAEALADPHEYSERFPDLAWALKVEQWREQHEGVGKLLPARAYGEGAWDGMQTRNLIEMMKAGQLKTGEEEKKEQSNGALKPVNIQQQQQQPTVNAQTAATVAPAAPSTTSSTPATVVIPAGTTTAKPATTAPPTQAPSNPASNAAIASTAATSSTAASIPAPNDNKSKASTPPASNPASQPTSQSSSKRVSPLTSPTAKPANAVTAAAGATVPPVSSTAAKPTSSASTTATPSPVTTAVPAQKPAVTTTPARQPAKPATATPAPAVTSTPTTKTTTAPPAATTTPAPAAKAAPSSATPSATSSVQAAKATASPSTSTSSAATTAVPTAAGSLLSASRPTARPAPPVLPAYEDDFGDLDGEDGAHTPSLDDINSSLADIDDEFREFE